jgi:hypothetical protein
VRTVCRLPRVWRFAEARNIRRHTFEDYLNRVSPAELEAIQMVVAAMKVLLLQTLAPRRVAGLGGLLECPSCESVGAGFSGSAPKLSVGGHKRPRATVRRFGARYDEWTDFFLDWSGTLA